MKDFLNKANRVTNMIAENAILQDTNRVLTNKMDEKINKDLEFLLKVIRKIDEKQQEIDALKEELTLCTEQLDAAIDAITSLENENKILRELLK